MYKLNFIKYVDNSVLEQTLKEFNDTPDTTATHSGGLTNDNEEIEITIFFKADDIASAIKQGTKLADDNDADIFAIYRTELICTEEIFNS